MSRSEWRPIAVAAVVAAVLIALAALQFRWSARLATARGFGLRNQLERGVRNVGAETDREIVGVLSTLGSARGRGDAEARLGRSYAAWVAGAAHAGLVSALWIIDANGALRWSPERETFEPGPSPVAWDDLRGGFSRRERRRRPGPPVLVVRGADGPLLVAPIAGPPPRLGVIALDASYARDTWLPEVVERHFGAGVDREYDVTIVDQASETVIFSSDPTAPLTREAAAVAAPLLPSGPPRAAGPPERPPRWGPPRRGRHVDAPGWHAEPLWELRVAHRDGSLESVVAQTRRRALAAGFGVLALLGGSAAFLGVSAIRAQRLARQQMQFVAGISHELNTPLAAIRAAGQNLADGVVTDADQVARYGSALLREERRLAELVGQVMDFARLRGVRSTPSVPVTIEACLTEAMNDRARDAEEQGVSLVSRGAPAVKVIGDPAALRTAFGNLIGNGIKYGTSQVEVAVAVSPRSVVVTVSDDGPGIAPGDRKRVFEPFYRGPSTESAVPGSGLGLSLVRDVARAHGGRVGIVPTERGCRVRLELPRAAAEDA